MLFYYTIYNIIYIYILVYQRHTISIAYVYIYIYEYSTCEYIYIVFMFIQIQNYIFKKDTFICIYIYINNIVNWIHYITYHAVFVYTSK